MVKSEQVFKVLPPPPTPHGIRDAKHNPKSVEMVGIYPPLSCIIRPGVKLENVCLL